MNEFLKKSKHVSQTLSSFSKVHVVIGNEACDLDSTVSAITHAYHLSQDSQSGEEAIIPVLNIPRDELPLRTEITHLLPRCNIQLADLICRDEIDLKSVPNLTLTLVDHNVPAQGDTWLDEYVVEVIDHHVSSRHDDEDRVISITREMVGSCSTLVARQILDKHLEILDHQLVKLLLGTILLDTLNMSEAAGRTTPTDEDVVQRLGKLSPRINLQELFNDVQTAKFNISGLTTPQILRKDFKSASSASCKIGFSSVTLPLQDVLDREDLETSLQNFCEHRFLDMNIIMTIDFEGSRQLAIYSEDPILRETIEERLQGSVLELERIDSSVTNLSAFDQHNRKASRKVVLPLVEEILRTLDKDSDSDEEDEHGENGPSENREELSSNVNNANNMAEEGQQNGKVMPDDWGEPTPESLHEIDNRNNVESNEQGSKMVGTDLGVEISSGNPFGGSGSADLLGGNPFSAMTGSIEEGGDDPFDPLSQSGNAVHNPTQSTDDDDPFGLSLDPFSFGSTPLSPEPESNLNSSNPFQSHTDPFSSDDNVLLPTSDPNPSPSNPFSDGPGPSSSLLDLDPVTPDISQPSVSVGDESAQSTGDLLGSFLDPIPVSGDLPSFADNPETVDSSSSQLQPRLSVDDPFSLMTDTLNDQSDLSMTKSDPSLSLSDSLALVPDAALSGDENSISISDPCLTITESKDTFEEQPEVVGTKSPVEDSDPFSPSHTMTKKSSDPFHIDDSFGMNPLNVKAPSDDADLVVVGGIGKEGFKGFEDDFGMASMNVSSSDPFGTIDSTPSEDHVVDELNALGSTHRQTSFEEVEVVDENILPDKEPVSENAIDIESQSESLDSGPVKDLAGPGNVDSEDAESVPLPNGDQSVKELEKGVKELDVGSDANTENPGPATMGPFTSNLGDVLVDSSDNQRGLDPFGMQEFTVQPSPKEDEGSDENVLPGDEPIAADAMEAVDVEAQSKFSDQGSVEDVTVEGEFDNEGVQGTSLPVGESSIQEQDDRNDVTIEIPDPVIADPFSGGSNDNSAQSPDDQSGVDPFGMQDFTVELSSQEVEVVDVNVLPEIEPLTEDSVDIEIHSKSSDQGSVEDNTVEGEFDTGGIQDTSLPGGESIVQEQGDRSDTYEIPDPVIGDPFSGGSNDNSAQSPDDQSGVDPFGMQDFTVELSSQEVEVVDVNVLPEIEPLTEDSVDIEIHSKSSDHGSMEDDTVEGEFDTGGIQDTSLPGGESIVQEQDDRSDTNEIPDSVILDPFGGGSNDKFGQSSVDQSGVDPFGMQEFTVQPSSEEVEVVDVNVLPENEHFTEGAVDIEMQSKSSDHGSVEDSVVKSNTDSEDVQGPSLPDEESSPQELDHGSESDIDKSDLDNMDPFSVSSSGNRAHSPDHQSGLDPFGMAEFTLQPGVVNEEQLYSESFSAVNYAHPPELNRTEDQNRVDLFGMSSFDEFQSVPPVDVPSHQDNDLLPESGKDENQLKERVDTESVSTELHGISEEEDVVSPPKTPRNSPRESSLAEDEDRSFSQELDEKELSARFSYLEEKQADDEAKVDYEDYVEEDDDVFSAEDKKPGQISEVSGNEDSTPAEENDLVEREFIVEDFTKGHEVPNAFASPSEVDDSNNTNVTVAGDEGTPGVEEPEELNIPPDYAVDVRSDYNDETGEQDFDKGDSRWFQRNDQNYIANILSNNMVDNAVDISAINSGTRALSDDENDTKHSSVYSSPGPGYMPVVMEPNPDPLVYIQAKETERLFEKKESDQNYVAEMIYVAEHGEPVSSFKIDTPPFHSDTIGEDSVEGVDAAVTSDTEEVVNNVVIEDTCSAVVNADLETSPFHSDENEGSTHHETSRVDPDKSKETDVNYVAEMLAKSMVENAVDIHTYKSRDDAMNEREDVGVYTSAIPYYKPEIMEPNPDPSVYIQAEEAENMFASGRVNEGNYIAEMIANDMGIEDGMNNKMSGILDLVTSEVSSDVHASHPLNEDEGIDLAQSEDKMNYVADLITDDMVEEAHGEFPEDVGPGDLLTSSNDKMPDLVPSEERNNLVGVQEGGFMGADIHFDDLMYGEVISPVLSNEVQAAVPDEFNLLDSQGEQGNVVAELISDDMIHGDGDDEGKSSTNLLEDVSVSLREEESSGYEGNNRDFTEEGESGFKEEDDDNGVAEVQADDITFEEGESMMSTPDLLMSAQSDLKVDFFQNIGSAEQSSPQGSDDEEDAFVAKDTYEDQSSSESDGEESKDQFQADGDGFEDIENDWSPNDIKVELSTVQYTVNDTLTVSKPCTTTGTPLSPLPEETEVPEGISGEISVNITDDVCEESEGIDSEDHQEREHDKVLPGQQSYSEDEDWEEEEIPDHDKPDVTPHGLSLNVDNFGSDTSGVSVVISNETKNGSDTDHGDHVLDAIEKVEEEIVQSATNKTYDILSEDIDDVIEEEIEPTSDEENTNGMDKSLHKSEESFPKFVGYEEVNDNDKAQVGNYAADQEVVWDMQYHENDLLNEKRDNTKVVPENVISAKNNQETEAGVNMLDLGGREEGPELPTESVEQGNVVVDISEDTIHDQRGLIDGLMGDTGEVFQIETTGVKAVDEIVEDNSQQQSYQDEGIILDKLTEGEGSKDLHDHEREHDIENEHLESMGGHKGHVSGDPDKPTWDGDYHDEGWNESIEKDEIVHASMEYESLAEEMPNADNTPAIASSMHIAASDVELDYSQAEESIIPDATPKELSSNELVLEIDKNSLEGHVKDHPENVEDDNVKEEMVVAAISSPVHSKPNMEFYQIGEDSPTANKDGKESTDDGEAKIFSYPDKWTDEDQDTMDNVFPDLMVKDVINEESSEEELSDKDEEQEETNLEVMKDASESDVVQITENDQKEDLINEEVTSTEQSMPERDLYPVNNDPDSQQSAYEDEFSQEDQVPRSALVDKVLTRMLAEDKSTNEYVPSEDEMVEIEDVSASQEEEIEDSNLREIRAGNEVTDEIGILDDEDEDVGTGSETQTQEEISISSKEINVTESSPSVSVDAIYDSNQMTYDGSGQDTSQDFGDAVMDNSSSNDVTVSLNDDILHQESDAEDSTPANDLESETVGTQDHTVTDASITDVSVSEQETKSDGSSGQSYLVVEPYERFIISDIEEADEENEDGAGSAGPQGTDKMDTDHVVENWFNNRSMSSEFGEGLTEEENRQKEAYEKWAEPVEVDQIEHAVSEETQMLPPTTRHLDEIPEEVALSSTQVESSITKEGVQEDNEIEDKENPREGFLHDKYFENSFGENVSDADSNKTDQEEELATYEFSVSEEREGEVHAAIATTSTDNQGQTENDPDEEAVRSLAKEYVDQVVMDAAISYRMSSDQQAISDDEEERDSTKKEFLEATACAIFEHAAEEYIDHVVSQEDEEAEPKVAGEYFERQESKSGEGDEVQDSDETAPEILVCRYTEPRETAMPFIMESGEDLDADEVNNLSDDDREDGIAVDDPGTSEVMEQDSVVQEIVPVVENMPVTETAMAFVMESGHYASSEDEEEVESHDGDKGMNGKEENGFDDDYSRVMAEKIPEVQVIPALGTEESIDSEMCSEESGDADEENEPLGASAAIEELIAPAVASELQTNPTDFYHLSNDEDDFDDTYSDLLEESKKLESDIAMLSTDVVPEVDIHVSPAHDPAVVEDDIGSEFLPHIEPSISEQTRDVTEESVPSEEVIVPLQQGEEETLPSQYFEEESEDHASEDETMNIEEVAREFVNDVINKATKNYVESGHDSAIEEPSNGEGVGGNMIPEETVPQDGDDSVFEEYDHFDDSSIPSQIKDNKTSVPQTSRDFKKTVSLEESLVAGNLLVDSDDESGLSLGEGNRVTRPTELPLLTASGQGLLTTPSKKSRVATSAPAGMSPGSILSGDTPVSLFTPDFESVTSTPGSLSDQEAEALETGSRLLPMSPFDKKSISVDESVTKNLEEEWDEKEAILNAIRAKQEEAERRNMQLEDPSMRQVSLDSEDAAGKIQGVSVDDEWQDDEYSRQALQGSKNGVRKSEESDSFYRRPVPKDEREAGDGAEHTLTSDGVVLREKKLTRPNTLLNRLSVQSVNSVFSEGSIDLDNISDEDEAEAEKAHSQAKKSASKQGDPSGARPKEKRKIRAELSLNLDDTITSQHTDDGTTPAILTPTSTEMSWEDDTPMNKAEPIEEYTAREEHEDRWRWRKVNLGGKDYTIDMKAINPYKKVLSHGGYYGEGLNAIIVFASCYLPEKSKKDYTYIMNNLFLYVVSTLELLVAQEYIIIYFHGSASRAKIPSLGWMRKCYQMIDRKLRKSLKGLYLVHPTTWLKAIVQLTKPFISHKFSNKLKFVKSLAELKTLVSMEYVYVPEEVKRFDQNKNKGGGTIWGWIAGPPPVDDDDWFSLEEGYDSDYSITADFLLSPHNPPNWHRRRQRKRLLIKAGHFNFSSSDEEGTKEGDADGRRHHRRNLRQHHKEQHPVPTSSSHHEDESAPTTPGDIGINLGPAISPQDYLTEWYFKRRTQSCSGFIEDDTFSYNHIIATPEVERRTWKEVFGDELDHGSVEYDGEDEDEDADCCDGNSATESHGQLELSS